MVKCEHCNLVYNEGVFCVKCGKKMVEYDELAQDENDNITRITLIDESIDKTAPSEELEVEWQFKDDSDRDSHSDVESEIYKAQTEDELISTPTLFINKLDNEQETDQQPEGKKRASFFGYIKKRSELVGQSKWLRYSIIAIVFVVVAVIGGIVYDFNTSQIYDVVDRNIKDDYLLADIVDRSFDKNKFNIALSESEINGLIYQLVDYQALSDNFGENVKAFYYDAKRQAFVANFDTSIAKTSLLFDVVFETDNKIRLSNIRVGKREHNYPLLIIKFFTGFKSDEININSQIYQIDKFEQGTKLVIDGSIKETFLLNIIDQIRKVNKARFIDYIVSLTTDETDGKIIVDAYNNFQLEQTKIILSSAIKSHAARTTWLMLLDQDTQNNLFYNINASLVFWRLEGVSSLVNDFQSRRVQYLKDYERYVDEQAVKRLTNDIEAIYESIVEEHMAAGLPIKLVPLHGRFYSRNLGKYYDGKRASDDGNYYLIFAINDEMAIGVKTKDGFSYVTRQKNGEISDAKQVESKEALLASIEYEPIDGPAAHMLPKNDPVRDTILQVVKAHLKSAEKPFVRYLSSDGKYAFLICSTVEDVQKIIKVLLEKDSDGVWHVKLTDDSNSMLEAFKDAIAQQSFNVKVLPPFDIEDFKSYYYQAEEIERVTEYLKAKKSIVNSSKVKFFSRAGDNLNIEFDNGAQVLIIFSEGSKTSFEDLILIDNTVPIEQYYSMLKTNKAFPNDLPIYLFTH